MTQRSKLLIAFGVAGLAVLSLIVYLIWSGYQQAIRTAQVTTRNTAEIIEARLDATLRRAEADLIDMVRYIPMEALSPQAVPGYARAINEELELHLFNFPELNSLRVFDAEGDLLYSSGTDKTPLVNVSDRQYFREAINRRNNELVFSEVMVGRALNRKLLLVGRVLRDRLGRFRGIANAAVDLAYYENLFRSLNIGAGGVVSVYRSDVFTEVVRWPATSQTLNTVLPPSAWSRKALARGDKTASYETQAVRDGRTRIYSTRALGQYPFFINVGEARDEVLAAWWRRTLVIGVLSLALIGISIGLIFRLQRAERRLRKNEAQMHDTFEQAAVGIAHIAPDGYRILMANTQFCRLLGFKRGELIGADCRTHLAPEDLEEAAADLAKIVSGEVEMISGERRLRKKDGTSLWVNRSLSLVRNAAGQPQYYILIIEDISARKWAEETLRLHDARYRTVVETSSDGFWAVDIDGRLCDVNEAYARRSGYAHEELLGMRVYDLDALEEAKDVDARIRKIVRRGGDIFESVHRTKDGSLWPVEVSVSYRDDQPDLMLCFLRDITERKQRMAEIVRFAAIVESSQVAIISRTLDGIIDSWNPAAEHMFGYSAQEIVGQNISIIVPPSYQSEYEANSVQLNEGQIVSPFETVRVAKDGHSMHVSISAFPIRNALDVITGVAIIVSDIGERKRLLDLHLQAQKLESLGTLSGGIAHDFNNLLTAIRGNVDLAIEDVGPDHAAAQSLEEIRKAGLRAGELVRRIMAFSRPAEPRQAVVDLALVVEEVLKLLRSTLSTGIALTMNFAKDTPPVLADAGQVHEVIVNLTTNAAYAIGPRAGSIDYRLEPVLVDENFLQGTPDLKPGRYARLAVTDSGGGIKPEVMARIFDAFYTTKPAGEGTGLGLSMVYGTMKSHGGAVTVASAPGKGSSFALYFPAADENAEKEKKRITQPIPIQSKMGIAADERSVHEPGQFNAAQRVLYLDDEKPLVFLASRVLSRLGHLVSGFTEPEEALAAFRANPRDYDIVVTDLAMPHMTGFEFSKEVLALRPEIPVLLTTGYIRTDDEANARAIGIREVILKPATVDELADVLDRIFRNGANGNSSL